MLRTPVSSWLVKFGLLVALVGGAGRTTQAQCVPLRALLHAATDPAFALDSLDAFLPAGQWNRHRPLPGGNDEPFWIHDGSSTNPGTGTLLSDDAQLSLRRNPQSRSFDVLLKTTHRPCLGELRAELRRAGFKPEPVTCINCLGERFVGPTCTVTLFDQREGFEKGNSPYPYVIAVRRTSSASGGSGSAPAALGTRPGGD